MNWRSFWSSFVLHLSNQIEADRRNLANNLLANHLTGMTVTSPHSVIYLLDEYNTQQGTKLTVQDVYKEANFPGRKVRLWPHQRYFPPYERAFH